MNKGWVKINRSMLDWQWYDDNITFKLLLHLIITANFEDKKWKGILIKSGQQVLSQVKLSKKLKVTRKTLRLHLKRLKDCGEVSIEVTNKYTLVTLIKWEQMQIKESKVSSKVNNKVSNKVSTTKEHKENKEESIPDISVFMLYLKDDYLKSDEQRYQKARLRMIDTYNAWKLNDWKDGNDKPIKNWKQKAIMQLRYI